MKDLLSTSNFFSSKVLTHIEKGIASLGRVSIHIKLRCKYDYASSLHSSYALVLDPASVEIYFQADSENIYNLANDDGQGDIVR